MARRCGVQVTTQAVEQRVTQDLADFLEALFRRGDPVPRPGRPGRGPAARAVPGRVPPRQHHDRPARRAERPLPRLRRQLRRGAGRDEAPGPARPARRGPRRGGHRGGARLRPADPAPTDALAPGSLRIADLGYFDTKVFRHLEADGVFWISRLAFGTEIMTPDGRRSLGSRTSSRARRGRRSPDRDGERGEAGLPGRGLASPRRGRQPPTSEADRHGAREGKCPPLAGAAGLVRLGDLRDQRAPGTTLGRGDRRVIPCALADRDAGCDPDDQYPHSWESHTEFAGRTPPGARRTEPDPSCGPP